ncbi:hypothetical protein FQN57_003456 [Myotisia sp. PD_48]|nr:hypothetical protein FQN57_003456 [Myotisia sp. PD_48]
MSVSSNTMMVGMGDHNPDGVVHVRTRGDDNKFVDLKLVEVDGNQFIFDDYPNSGPIYNALNEKQKDVIRWAAECNAVALFNVTY